MVLTQENVLERHNSYVFYLQRVGRSRNHLSVWRQQAGHGSGEEAREVTQTQRALQTTTTKNSFL